MTAKKTCLWCPDPPLRGMSMCKDCLAKAKQYRDNLRADRIKNGFCPRCGEKVESPNPDKPHTSCADCRRKDADRKKKNRVPAKPKEQPAAFEIPEI